MTDESDRSETSTVVVRAVGTVVVMALAISVVASGVPDFRVPVGGKWPIPSPLLLVPLDGANRGSAL